MSLGAGYLIRGGVGEREEPFKLVSEVGIGRVAGVPYLVLISIAVAIVFGVILALTRFGRALAGKPTTEKIGTESVSITKDNLEENRDSLYKANC